jgi:hypothetical protein
MKHSNVYLAASLVIFSAPSWGASTTETITISGTMPNLGTVATPPFPAFDPKLGKLVSMSVHLSGTLDYTGKGIPADEGACLELEDQSFPTYYADLANVYIPALGSGIKYAFTARHVSDPNVLSRYTGAGSRHLIVYDCGGNLTDRIELAGSGTVTYNYDPPAPPHHPVPTWYPSIIRLSLEFAGPVTPPPGSPVEAIVGFVDLNGVTVGQPVTVAVVPGQVTSVDLNSGTFLHALGQHANVLPVVSAPAGQTLPPLQVTTEVFDGQSGFGALLSTENELAAAPPSLAPQGLAGGQSMRLIATAYPPNACAATLSFADSKGNPTGTSLQVNLRPGQSVPLDFNSSILSLQPGQRIEVQPKVMVQSSGSSCGATAEVFDQATGRTWTYQSADVHP